MSVTPESLGDATHAVLRASNGEPPADVIEQLGGWQRIANEIGATVNEPASVPLVRLVVRDAPAGGAPAVAALPAVVDAVLAMGSPAGFGDCVEALATSPAVLDVVADQLADGLFAQVAAVAAQTDPTPVDVERAATALEGATRLAVGGYGTHFSLLAALERFRTPIPRRFAAAVVRSVGTAVDYWPEAATLVEAVKAVAGLSPPSGSAITGADPDEVASDASWVLANIELIKALRAVTSKDMVTRLEASLGYLRSAQSPTTETTPGFSPAFSRSSLPRRRAMVSRRSRPFRLRCRRRSRSQISSSSSCGSTSPSAGSITGTPM